MNFRNMKIFLVFFLNSTSNILSVTKQSKTLLYIDSPYPSVHNPFFSNARNRVISTIETARDCGLLREVIGSDEGDKDEGDEGGGDERGSDNKGDVSDARVSGLVYFL